MNSHEKNWLETQKQKFKYGSNSFERNLSVSVVYRLEIHFHYNEKIREKNCHDVGKVPKSKCKIVKTETKSITLRTDKLPDPMLYRGKNRQCKITTKRIIAEVLT